VVFTVLFWEANMREIDDIDVRAGAPRTAPPLVIPYDPFFLGNGFEVPLPALEDAILDHAWGGGRVLDYVHFSLVMNRRRRLAFFSAANVDASRIARIPGNRTWLLDERIPEKLQVGAGFYAGNPWDRGHITRREDVKWGPVREAKAGAAASCYYTNAAPQHESFNQDEWLELESWVLDHAPESHFRLCVITGPVLRDDDRVIDGVGVPSAFWKLIVARDAAVEGNDLTALAFLMRQDDASDDKLGARMNNLQTYQVTIGHLEALTALDFGDMRNVEELGWAFDRALPGAAAWPVREVRTSHDLVFSGADRRARGRSALRGGRRAMAPVFSPAPRAGEAKMASPLPRNGAAPNVGAAAVARGFTATSGGPAAAAPRRLAAAGGCGCADDKADPQEAVQRLASGVYEVLDTLVARVAGLEKQRDATFDDARFRSAALRIVGGEPVGTDDPYRDCVCIGDRAGTYFCTGTLIGPRLVLTAAHCVAGGGAERVLIGRRLSEDLAVIRVVRSEVHPFYTPGGLPANDLAVLVLEHDVDPALATPIPLITPAGTADAQEVLLVGFGYNSSSNPAGFGIKRLVRVGITALCRAPGEDLSTEEDQYGFSASKELVAGRKGLGKDSCNGDSGGPAYVELFAEDGSSSRFLLGVTSRSTADRDERCGDGGVYTVATQYLGWIEDVAAEVGAAVAIAPRARQPGPALEQRRAVRLPLPV